MRRLVVTLALLALCAPASAGAQSVSVADPDGGPRWSARLTTSAGGQTCAVLRRGAVAKGRACERLSRGRVFNYAVRTETTTAGPRQARTILVVTFAPSVVRARLQTPDGVRTYRRGRRPRLLLVVLAGRVERPPLRVDVRDGARTRVVRSAVPTGLQVGDPLGGPAWRTATEAARGLVCVSWARVLPRFEDPPARLRGDVSCGRAGASLPVFTAEVVDGRLVIAGLATAQATDLVLRGAGAPRRLTVDRRSRSFLVVLPAGPDPAQLRLDYLARGDVAVTRAPDVVRPA